MRNRLTACVSTLILVSTALALPALANTVADASPSTRPENASGTAICGHTDEMDAARIALQENRREDALRHLKRARSILVACEQLQGAMETADGTEGTPRLSI